MNACVKEEKNWTALTSASNNLAVTSLAGKSFLLIPNPFGGHSYPRRVQKHDACLPGHFFFVYLSGASGPKARLRKALSMRPRVPILEIMLRRIPRIAHHRNLFVGPSAPPSFDTYSEGPA